MNAKISNSQKAGGIVRDGRAAPYDFGISSVLGEAWARVNGMKAAVWGAIGWIFLVGIGFSILNAILQALSLAPAPSEDGVINPTTLQLIIGAIVAIVSATVMISLRVGFDYLGVRRSVDLPLRSRSIFSALHSYWKFFGLLLLQYFILSLVGMVAALLYYWTTLPSFPESAFYPVVILIAILSIFGVYLLISFMFSYLLIYEKKLGVCESLCTSFFAFSQHWFKLSITYILMIILVAISAIPLGIGLIWTFPMMTNLKGIIYRIAMGVEEVRK